MYICFNYICISDIKLVYTSSDLEFRKGIKYLNFINSEYLLHISHTSLQGSTYQNEKSKVIKFSKTDEKMHDDEDWDDDVDLINNIEIDDFVLQDPTQMIVDDLEVALEDENMESDGNNDQDNTGNDCHNNVNTCDDDGITRSSWKKKNKDGIKELGLGEYVVYKMTEGLEGKGYHIYFDNFFYHKEESRDCVINYSCTNRKAPCCATIMQINCAKAVNDYRRCMGGEDRADMLKSYYAIDRKSRKWWHRLFWHFIYITLVKSFIISKQPTKNGLKLKDFRLEVIFSLVGANRLKRDLGRRLMRPFSENSYKVHLPKTLRTDQAKHMPVHGTSRRCALCSTAKYPYCTNWACNICRVGLLQNSK
ncbi:hypothetical protein NQ314_002937 [Rhamnusium bicolor]|uniref:PiggyBac transposable element-derived protein domain-containing protein n=1 Tax=Rhamnusium bicolor TaxID=1586634 RepID=A0AAV8ZMZ7_9CUCU|nr:hypothetical protein NQ314_002937 [Rhamnusium bicolor]